MECALLSDKDSCVGYSLFLRKQQPPPLSVDILGIPDSLCLCFLFVLFLSFLIPVTPAHFYVPLCTLVPKGD